MTTPPTWPQLAGWLVTATAGPSSGQATVVLAPGEPPTGCAFVHRPPDDLRVELVDGSVVLGNRQFTLAVGPDGQVSEQDQPVYRALYGLLQDDRRAWDRADFHRPATPVRQTRRAGRLAWQVLLEAPRTKAGPLELVLDDQTGRLLREANHDPEQGWSAQLDRLQAAQPADEEFTHLGHRAADVAIARQQQKAELARLQPALPWIRRWPPGFRPESIQRGRPEAVLVTLRLPGKAADHPPVRVQLTRSRLGQPPHQLDETGQVAAWEHDGRTSHMALNGRTLTDDELRQVQASVVERTVHH